MSKAILRSHPNLGVFTRNHGAYLDSAVEAHRIDPSRPIAFRSQVLWATARDILAMHHSADVYMAPVGGDGSITHVGKLNHVHLDPNPADAGVRALLGLALPETQEEGLWDGKVKTLYLVTHTVRLERPFPMTELVKLSGGEALSANYGYSYSIVQKHRPPVIVDAPKDDRNYGFCKYSGRWVPRDNLISVNVKGYGADNQEEKVRIRLARSAHAEFWALIQSLEWDGVLRTRDELSRDASVGE